MDIRENIDITLFGKPQPTATSTVDRNTYRKKKTFSLEDSLSILSLNSINLSAISEVQHESSVQNQNDSAKSHSKNFVGLPSKYLKRVPETPYSCTYKLPDESSVSESDLLCTPKNTSTPLYSKNGNKLKDLFTRTTKEGENVHSTSQALSEEQNEKIEADACHFTPGENAGNLLIADEMSWIKRNKLQAVDNSISIETISSDVSLGDFFRQKSDTISDFLLKSPEKNRAPVPLISFSKPSTISKDNSKDERSINASTIQRLLAQDNSTSRIINYICNTSGYREPFTKTQTVKEVVRNKDSGSSMTGTDQIHKKQDEMNCIVNKSITESSSTPTLPTRKNTSYISDNCQSDKENVDINIMESPELRPESRASTTSSCRTSSSLTSLPSGKLPIQTTECELIWGCVKVDKSSTRSFLLRNASSKSIKIEAGVSGREFKLRRDERPDSEALSSVKIVLHPHETKNICVSFMPTRIGAAIDSISFRSLDPNLQQTVKQCIRLYGYGGLNRIELEDLIQDTNNKYWLFLGKLDNGSTITKTFTVTNSGQLPSFVYLTFKSKEYFKVSVYPNFFTLIPQESEEVTLTFKPNLEDLQSLQKCLRVADIGCLSVISGAEITRWRLRRLCKKKIAFGEDFEPLIDKLCEKINGEVMPSDLDKFKESSINIVEIIKLLTQQEIILTVERDPDQSIIPQYTEDSGMFQSLVQDTTVVENTTKMLTALQFEPTTIFLNPPKKVEDFLILKSGLDRTTQFEISYEPAGLNINPKHGTLCPGQSMMIQLSLSSTTYHNYKVIASVADERVEAAVIVIS